VYIPKHFQENNQENLTTLIAQYPFASLITHSATAIEVNHLPFYLAYKEGRKVLFAHIAKANPLWKTVQESEPAFIVFNGPNGYISPNYYPSKQQHGRAVPTWNYVAVHVKGTLKFLHDNETKLTLVKHLTNLHESNQPKPWSVSDAPSLYIEKMLSAIVGLEVEINSIVGKCKISQNQSLENQQGVISGLAATGATHLSDLASMMTEHKKG
jgi:transcriptional regulator